MASDPFAQYVKETPTSNKEDLFAKFTKNAPNDIETTKIGSLAASAAESAAVTPPSLYGVGVGSRVPGPWPVKVAGGLVGGIVGGAGGYKAIQTLEGLVDSTFGTDIVKTREAQQEQHPIVSALGGVAGLAAGPGQIVALQKPATMALGGVLSAGLGIAHRAVSGGDPFDKNLISIDFLGGAVIKTNALGDKIVAAGKGTSSTVSKRVDPVLEELKKTQETLGKPKVETAIPKVTETAFRKPDGTVETSGPKHDVVRKLESTDEQGFVTESGEFLTREEAATRARETGQLPEGHILEKPEEGLHSGDMRAAKDRAFELPPEKEDPFKWNVDKLIEKHTESQDANTKFATRKELHDNLETIQEAEESARFDAKLAKEKGDLESATHYDKLADSYKEQSNYVRDKLPASHITNKEIPTWQETHDIILGSKTVGEAFDKIKVANVGRPGQRQLIDLLAKSERVRGAKITKLVPAFLDKDNQSKVGLYYPRDNTVELGAGGDVRTLIHEAVHSATIHLLAIGEHASAKAIKELYELSKKSTTDYHYGHTDIREFVSEAFVDRQLAKHLNSIGETGKPIPAGSKEPSLWDNFKSIVKTGLGVKAEAARTALDDVLDHGALLIEAADTPAPWKGSDEPIAAMIEDPATNAGRTKFIDSMIKKYGEGYREAAEKLYDTKYANEGIVPMNHTQLGDLFYAIGKQGEADSTELFGRAIGKAGRTILSIAGIKGKADGLYQKATQDGVTSDLRKKWRLAAEGKVKLDTSEQALYDKYIKSAEEELKVLTKRQSDLGRVKELNFNEEETGRHVPRIAVPKRKTALEHLKTIVESDQGGFNADIARDRGAVQEQGFFVVEKENGTRVLIMPKGKDIIGYTKEGKPYKFGQNVTSDAKGGTREVRAGDKYGGWRIKEATVSEIEAVTPYRYLKDYQAVVYKRLEEARAFDRAHNHLDNLIKSDYFKTIAKLATDKDVDPSWKTLAAADKVPQLAGYKFEPMVRATIEDYARVWQPNAVTWLTSGIIKNMMLNPLPHMNNEAWHWYNARGLTGWVTPQGVSRFLSTTADSMRSVVTQDNYYVEIMRHGGSILGAQVRNSHTYREILEKGLKEVDADPVFKDYLAKAGLSVKNLYDGVSKYASIAMWTVRDAMYVQLVKEQQQLHGKNLTDAIKEVERHMPSYRIDPTVLGSRELSKILQNPNVSVFSRYHFGMVKSLVNTARDATFDPKFSMSKVNPMTGKSEFKPSIEFRGSKEEALMGLDQAAAMVFAIAVLYPMLDYGAQVLTDNKNAHLRQAGPYHLFEAVKLVSSGDKEPLSILQPIFTFNPVLLAGVQLPFNREFYTGKQIYHPSDKASLIAKDLSLYGARQIPQVSTGLRVSDKNAGGAKQWAAQQLDIKLPTDKQLKNKEKWKQRNQSAARKRYNEFKKGD